MLAGRRLRAPRARAAATARISARALRPGEERRVAGLRRLSRNSLGSCRPCGRAAGVGQEDDRRLEPLAGVDGHHAHAVRLVLHVALDPASVAFDLGEKIMQRGRVALLMRQRESQEFVDRVGGLGSQPTDQRAPAAVLAEQAGVESEGRKRLRPPAPRVEPARGFARRTFLASRERLGERAVPPRRELEQIVVVEADQRRLERRGERQIVVRQQRRAAGGDEVHHRDMVAAVSAGRRRRP